MISITALTFLNLKQVLQPDEETRTELEKIERKTVRKIRFAIWGTVTFLIAILTLVAIFGV